jgi:hypothetical protein
MIDNGARVVGVVLDRVLVALADLRVDDLPVRRGRGERHAGVAGLAEVGLLEEAVSPRGVGPFSGYSRHISGT